jgi:hypothetical protein
VFESPHIRPFKTPSQSSGLMFLYFLNSDDVWLKLLNLVGDLGDIGAL